MDMTFVLIAMIMLVPLLFTLCQRAVNCPQCDRSLPRAYAPWNKTRRQWVKGGFYCQQCQIEVDLQGHRVSPDEPSISTAALLRVMVPMLLTPVVAIVVGYFVFVWGKELIEQQAMAAEVTSAAPLIARRPAPVATKFGASREELRARIILHEHGLVHGCDLYSFGIELENLSSAATVEFDAEDVMLEFTDEHGRIIPPSANARSGPAIPVLQALIPYKGYTVFSTHDHGMGLPAGQKRFNAGYKAWQLTPGRYQVTGSVLVRTAFAPSDLSGQLHFSKDQPKIKLTIPRVGLVVSK